MCFFYRLSSSFPEYRPLRWRRNAERLERTAKLYMSGMGPGARGNHLHLSDCLLGEPEVMRYMSAEW